MKRIIFILFVLMSFYAVNAQTTYPTFLPSPKGDSALAQYGYVWPKTLLLLPNRDTAIRPKYPSLVYWPHAGVDSTLWIYDMYHWKQVTGTGGGGTVVWGDITGDIHNQTDLINYIDSVVNASSGSIEYVTQGYGIKVDSALRVYTVMADTVVMASKTWFYNRIDSLILTFNNTYVKYTDTASMLSHYVRRVLAGSNVTVDNTNPQYPIVSAAGSTGVSSVGLAAPSIFTVTNSPVTTSGTLTFTPNNAQGDLIYGSTTNTLAYLNKSTTANSFLKNSGTSNNPAWATLTPSDIPGVGTVTSFSSGNLSPLFTTSVATSTSTPALSYSLSTATAWRVFSSNASTTPAYNQLKAEHLNTTYSNGNMLITDGSGNLSWTTAGITPSDTAGMLSNYVRRVLAGTNVTVDNTNPQYPIVSASGSGGTTYAYTVKTMANLYAFNATSLPDSSVVIVGGYYSPGDGGGGSFMWSTSSTATSDSGTIIQPTLGTGRFLRITSGAPVNVKWFGAIPNGSRTVDTRIQFALNKTGHIVIPYDTLKYIINDRLLIKSNTWLDVDPRDTIYLANGVNTVMLRNYTSDTTGITDHDIIVSGGIWDGNWNNNPGTNVNNAVYKTLQSDKGASPIKGISGNLDFVGVQNLVVKNLSIVNGLLFPTHFTHVTNLEVGFIHFVRTAATISDGIHLSGPITNFYIHDITGRTGDDCIALGAWEWLLASPGGQSGDITKGTIERIHTDTTKWAAIKMYGGTNASIKDIVIKDVRTLSENQGFYWGQSADAADPTHTTGIGTISNVTMTDVAVGTLGTVTSGGITYGSVMMLNCNFTDIVLKNIILDSTYKPYTNLSWLNLRSGNTISSLTIDNFYQKDSLAWSNIFEFNGVVSNYKLSNSNFVGAGGFTGARAFVTSNFINSSPTNAVIDNCRFSGIVGAIACAGTNSVVTVSNNYFENFNYATYFSATSRLSLSSNHFATNNNCITGVSIPAGTLTGFSSGNNTDGSGLTILKTSGTLRWNGVDLAQDVALLTPSSYDLAKNNNAGSAALGLVQYNGSAWAAAAAANTFSTGLTATGTVVTADLSTGKSGGQSVIGGTASGNNLTLSSTSHATKGKIIFGTSAYDEANNRLGIGTTSPIATVDVAGALRSTATTVPASGEGLELFYGSSTASVAAYDRTGAAYKAMNVNASTLSLNNFTNTTVVVGNGTASATSKFQVPGNQTTMNNVEFGNFGIQSYSNTNGFVSSNYYFDGTNNKYRATGEIAMFQFGNPNAGDLSIRTAPSGTGGTNATITDRLVIKNTGNVGIGVSGPTAVLNLKAGTATANTAPLKFTSGTNLTTPEAGAMEYNGTNLFFSPSTVRHTIYAGLAGSATLDFASTGAAAVADLTITVTGAALGDPVELGVPNGSVTATATFTAWVSATNTVTVRFSPKATEDPASGTFNVFVKKN